MIRNIGRKLRALNRDRLLKRRLRSEPRRVVIGSSGVYESGWVPSDADQLNLLNARSWVPYVAPASIDALLAEHVWEHLSLAEGRAAAQLCFQYLKPGGYLRVAVPDGLFPDEEYQKYIGIGGVGGGNPGGHKVVYTYKSLVEVFESAGFRVRLLEYHDEAGVFHMQDWAPAEGMVRRSKRFDPRGPVSIILDAKK